MVRHLVCQSTMLKGVTITVLEFDSLIVVATDILVMIMQLESINDSASGSSSMKSILRADGCWPVAAHLLVSIRSGSLLAVVDCVGLVGSTVFVTSGSTAVGGESNKFCGGGASMSLVRELAWSLKQVMETIVEPSLTIALKQ
ncbi:hypothetical protein Tco_1226579 [Tanacetum coccineum]